MEHIDDEQTPAAPEVRGHEQMRGALNRITQSVIRRDIAGMYGAISELYRAGPDDINEDEREVLRLSSAAAHNASLAVRMDDMLAGAGARLWADADEAVARARQSMSFSERSRSQVRLCIDCDAPIGLCECN